MAAVVPLSERAPTPSIHYAVNEIKPAGSTALFLTTFFINAIKYDEFCCDYKDSSEVIIKLLPTMTGE